MIAEHSMVVLNCDKPSSGLYAGDVGAVVHIYAGGLDHVNFFLPFSSSGGEGAGG